MWHSAAVLSRKQSFPLTGSTGLPDTGPSEPLSHSWNDRRYGDITEPSRRHGASPCVTGFHEVLRSVMDRHGALPGRHGRQRVATDRHKRVTAE